MTGPAAHYSARDIEARILGALRAAGLDPARGIAPGALGALDHFHTGGLAATRELMRLARIGAGARVLDIGAGLAGPARLLAGTVGCRVDCIELSPDYVAGARLLNRLTGLDDRVYVHEGSALDLPFADGSFDAAWMQNVGMNIADKDRLYGQIARVLRPAGRFAFQEIVAGSGAPAPLPLPWASLPGDSVLASADELRALLEAHGLGTEIFEDVSDEQAGRPDAAAAVAEPSVRPDADAAAAELSLAVFVDDLARKAGNARRSLQDGRIRLVRGICRLR